IGEALVRPFPSPSCQNFEQTWMVQLFQLGPDSSLFRVLRRIPEPYFDYSRIVADVGRKCSFIVRSPQELFQSNGFAHHPSFAMAGAIPIIGVSPAPADGRSLRSISTSSIFGASPKRGTRYCESRGFRIRPLAKSMASKRAPPSPITIAPST